MSPNNSYSPTDTERTAEPGKKFDADKARYDLIPGMALEELAKLFMMGGKKYGDWNWYEGMSWSRIFAAMMRHAWAWWRGEQFDREDGQHHLTSVAWCAMVLYTFEKQNRGTDDRRKV